MKTVVFTKAEIIKALKTEKLTPGAFARYVRKPSSTREAHMQTLIASTKQNCNVCAVGAILRNKFKGYTIYDLNNLGDSVTKGFYVDYDTDGLLEAKNYLGALSCEFELLSGICTDESVIVNMLLEFVKTNFPTRFKVSLE